MHPQRDPKPQAESRAVYRASLIMGSAHGITHAYLLFFTPFLKIIQEALALDWVSLGGLVTIAYAAYGLGALPAGIISDKIGHRRTAVISALVPAAGCVLGFFATSYWAMAAAFILIGLGTSMYHPAANALVTTMAGDSYRGRALGIHGVGGNIGMLLAPVLTAGVVHFWDDWRLAFLLWALIGVGVAFVVSRGVPEVTAKKTKVAAPAAKTGAVAPTASKPATAVDLKALFTATIFAALGLVALQGFFDDGIFAYLPTFLQDDKGLSVVLSGLVTGLNFGAGVFGQLAGGFLSDAIGRRATVFWGSIGCAVMFAALPFIHGSILLLAGVFVMGFCVFMLQPPLNALVGDVAPAGVRGALFGVIFLAKYGIGAFAPFVGGLIVSSSGGLSAFFYLMAATAAAGLVLLIWVPAHRAKALVAPVGTSPAAGR